MKILLLPILALASCTSIDVKKDVAAENHPVILPEQDLNVVGSPVETKITVIEKPVYVPQQTQPAAQPRGTAAVQNAARDGTAAPQDFSHAAAVYDFQIDWVYEVYTQPMRATDIRLKPGESVVESPFISDSERWMLGAGISYEGAAQVQHIYVKPKQSNLSASLIINTSEREYHILLRSFQDSYMPIVRWRYFPNSMPQNYIIDSKNAGVISGDQDNSSFALADPRFLSFNYKITYGWFKKPKWLPRRVYDDGKKTYIVFPEALLQSELPAIFENRNDIVNYRVIRNIIVIDKLILSVSVRLDKYSVSISKQKGKDN
jgi:type IV secretion system protein VirB9